MNHRLASQPDRASLAYDLRLLGLGPGDTLMVHTAFRALGVRDPEAVILALLDVLGDGATLLMPALSWLQEPPDVHDTRATPSCVGFLPEYFRTRPGTRRSLHPTHSVWSSSFDHSLRASQQPMEGWTTVEAHRRSALPGSEQ